MSDFKHTPTYLATDPDSERCFPTGRWLPIDREGDALCRLGRHGCYLRFDQAEAKQHQQATMAYDAELMPTLELDREKMQQEVR